MNIRFLETAICLSELRNFRATADTLKITPAAISNRISAMEDEIGFRLFERDSRQVIVTPAGSSFVEGARDIVSRYRSLVQQVNPSQNIQGSVSIGLLPSMAMALLPDIAAGLREKLPNVKMSIVTESAVNIHELLEARHIDVALTLSPAQPTSFSAVELCSLGMYWVVAPHLMPQDADEVVTLEELARYPVISYEAGTYNHGCLVRYLEGQGVESSITHYSNALSTTVRMVIAGLGLAVLPPVVIQNELRAGLLKVLRVVPQFPQTRYSAIYAATPDSPLPEMIASIAASVAADFCSTFDTSLARRMP